MTKLIILNSLILKSSYVFAAVISTMQTVDKNTYPISTEVKTVPNMPRVRSQDSLGVCFGFSSATVAQHYICKQKNISCSNLKPTEEISPIGMVAWANTDKPEQRGGSNEWHSNIRFSGMGYGALGYLTAMRNNLILPESCYPFDQFANRYGDNKDAVDALISKLEKQYDKAQTEASACVECLLTTFKEDLGVKTTARDFAFALKDQTFHQHLYGAIFGSCEDDFLKLKPHPKFNMFPKQGQKANPQDVINKAKEVLATGNPLVLDAVCPYIENGKCLGGHSVTITGYRRVCKTQDKNSCREVLKIQNSWGESWQKENDDGWLDAKTLLGDKPLEEGAISWLSNP